MFSTTFIFSLCLCALGTPSGISTAQEHVDLIELNHFYDQQGRHVYDQVIFYEHSPETGRFLVRAWCLVEDREHFNRRPIKNIETNLYQVDWADKEQGLTRRITSRLFRESWTQLDPERANKKLLDERSRISLVQNPKKYLASQRSQEPNPSTPATESVAVHGVNTPLPPDAIVRTPSDALVVR